MRNKDFVIKKKVAVSKKNLVIKKRSRVSKYLSVKQRSRVSGKNDFWKRHKLRWKRH